MDIISLIHLTALAVLVGLIGYALYKLRRSVWQLHSSMEALQQVIDKGDKRVINAVQASTQECVNAICLSAFNLKFPPFLGVWSIDSFLGRWLVQHIQAKRPKCIVELGSGTSTVLIAKALSLLGENDVDHIAVDHEAHYLGITRELANINNIGGGITFLHTPLVNYPSYGQDWYDSLRKKLDGKRIDLLLIDGPPGESQPQARRPAMMELRDLLSDQCFVVLDDASRKEEREIARTWAKEIPGFDLTIYPEGHGLAVLKRCS